MTQETILREKLASCARIFAMQDMIGLFGHVSVYDPSAQRMYMTPSMGIEKTTLSAENMLAADLEGSVLSGDRRLPVEWPIHSVLHKTRGDALAVAHLHAHYSTIFSITERQFRPVTLQGTIFDDGVPVYKDPRLVTTVRDGESLASSLGARTAIFMRGHGVTLVAPDLEQVLFCAMILEDEARKSVHAAALGNFHCMAHDDCAGFHGKAALPERSKRAWNYYCRLESKWDKNPGTGCVPFV